LHGWWWVPAVGALTAVVWLAAMRSTPPTDTSVPRRAVPRPPPASVAVLAFANTGGDPVDEHLSDGLTDELISALGKVSGLKVIGRTSSFALKGRGLSVQSIADTLGVATVLEGSWRRVGQRLKVTAQLVNAPDGAVLWAEAYDRGIGDAMDVEEDIAQAIVAALRTRLVGAGGAVRAARAGTTDPAAYELYLQGRYVFVRGGGRENTLRAIAYFDQAIARDSGYARAYAGLADAYTRLTNFGYASPAEAYERAKAAARRALALDSTLAEAQVALSHAVMLTEFAWADAERGFRRAIALDPSYGFARAPFAICLSSQGRYDEALAQLDTAHLADPLALYVPVLRGRIYVSAHRPDDAIRVLLPPLELDSRLDLAYEQLGHAYLQKGRHADAIAALRRAAALSGPRDSAQLAYAYAVSGQRATAQAIVRSLLDPSRSGGALPYHIAMAYAGLDEPDSAFAWLERGYATKASYLVGVLAETGYTRLHGDPRWAPFLRRMGLAP
jgi:serine/threonine-protein kinase